MFKLWRPIFITVLFLTVLWRELNCVKSPNVMQRNPSIVWPFTRQRWNSTTFSRNLPNSCKHQIQFFTQLRCLHSSRNKTKISWRPQCQAMMTRIDDDLSPGNVTAVQGDTAMLVCTVVNIGDKSVCTKETKPFLLLLFWKCTDDKPRTLNIRNYLITIFHIFLQDRKKLKKTFSTRGR